MFDNNNQNFNNGNPLFGNVQNNGMNNEFNSEPTSNMNYQNNPYEQMPNTNSGYVAPNFNFGPNPGYDMQQTMQTNPVDMPPELGEIKNLNDATISNAPTMDVLGPMNIMPETLPKNNDLLDAYENGNLNVGVPNISNQMPEQSQNYGMPNNFNIPTNNYQNNSIDGFNNGMGNMNQGMNNDYMMNNVSYENYTQNTVMQNPYSNINPLPNSVPIGNNYDASNNFNPNSDIVIPSYDPTAIGSNDTSFNQNFDNSNLNNMQPTQEFNNDISSDLEVENSDNEMEKELSKEPDDSSLVNDESEVTSSDIEELPETNDNIVDNIDSEESEMANLGLDESYNEPDMLEIMDIDSDDSDKETSESDDESTNLDAPGSVSKNVEKIKSLIEELKAAGADIELEEFDFESMYQLIVKLNK